MIFAGIMAFVVLVILATSLCIYKKNIDKKEVKERLLCEDKVGGFAVATTFIPFFVFLFVSIICGVSVDCEWQKDSSQTIYSVTNHTGIEGHFVLGTGSINTEMYYFYFEEGELGLRIGKLKASETEIIESDSEYTIPEIVTYKLVPKKNDWFFGLGNERLFPKYKKVLSLPKGSIKVKYEIEL